MSFPSTDVQDDVANLYSPDTETDPSSDVLSGNFLPPPSQSNSLLTAVADTPDPIIAESYTATVAHWTSIAKTIPDVTTGLIAAGILDRTHLAQYVIPPFHLPLVHTRLGTLPQAVIEIRDNTPVVVLRTVVDDGATHVPATRYIPAANAADLVPLAQYVVAVLGVTPHNGQRFTCPDWLIRQISDTASGV